MTDFAQDWWPPSEDQARFDQYTRNLQLFDSDHKTAFERMSAKLPRHLREKLYLVQDYPRLVTEIYADLIYGAPPVISAPAQQEQLNELLVKNDFLMRLYQSELTLSPCGDAVWKVALAPGDDGQMRVFIEEMRPQHYFKVVDPFNCNRVLKQGLAWEVRIGAGDNLRRYLRVEWHYAGRIEHFAYRLQGFGKVGKVPVALAEVHGQDAPPDVELTRVPMPLLHHMVNVNRSGRVYGQSDYTEGLITLFDTANERISSMARVLNKHEEPVTVLPLGILNSRNRGNVRVEELEVIELTPDMNGLDVPRKLTWDAKLEASFQLLEKIEDKIFDFAAISPAMLGKDKAGNIESGRAMQMRFARMMNRVDRKRMFREPAIKAVLFCALWMEHAWLNKPLPQNLPEVTWRNGLPKDDSELTDVATRQVAAELMSRRTAIRYIRQVGDVEAEAELAQIEAERAQRAQTETQQS